MRAFSVVNRQLTGPPRAFRSASDAVSDFALARYESAGEVPTGGRGLGITPWVSINLTWTGGGQQLTYLVARLPTASAVLPERATTSFADRAPAYDGNLNCYVLFPLGPSGPLGVSDVLCARLGLHSQSDQVPRKTQSDTPGPRPSSVGPPPTGSRGNW